MVILPVKSVPSPVVTVDETVVRLGWA